MDRSRTPNRSFPRAFALAVLGWLPAGCSSAPVATPGLPAIGGGTLSEQARPITDRFTVFGDTQTHYSYGEGIYKRTLLADLLVSTAIRPPALDLFGESLWDEPCRFKEGPVVFLGDAADGSCLQEYERFFELIRRCSAAAFWVQLPGNHDGYLLGGSDTEPDLAQPWPALCGGKDRVMTKDRMVGRYVRELADRLGYQHRPPRAHSPLGEIVIDPAVGGMLLQQAFYRIDQQNRWQSFVVQRISLELELWNGTQGILLDTTQYSERPRLAFTHDAAMVASVQDDQRRMVDQWLAQIEPVGAKVVLFGHHPFQEFDRSTRSWLEDRLVRYPNVVLYVSGDTHAGRYYLHELGHGRSLVELNVGSLLDYPNEYYQARLWLERGGSTLLSADRNPQRSQPKCEPGWRMDPGAYTSYLHAFDQISRCRARRRVGTQGRMLCSAAVDAGRMQRALLVAHAQTWIHVLQLFPFSEQSAPTAAEFKALLDNPSTKTEQLARRCEAAQLADQARDQAGLLHPTPEATRLREFERCLAFDAAIYENSQSTCDQCAAMGNPFLRRYDVVELAKEQNRD